MYAKNYAKLVYNKDLFFSLLNTVLKTPADKVPDLTLVNTLAKRQAQELIADARAEEYFDRAGLGKAMESPADQGNRTFDRGFCQPSGA